MSAYICEREKTEREGERTPMFNPLMPTVPGLARLKPGAGNSVPNSHSARTL